jgi:hypothetical protein
VSVPPTGIAAIPTALTAFVGRTLYGPVNEPTLISSAGDFQNLFGGPWEPSPLSYAVADYFTTGGPQAQALIVRVHALAQPDNKELPPAHWVEADPTDPADAKKVTNGIATIAVNPAAPTAIPPPAAGAPASPPPPPVAAPPSQGKVLTLQAASPGAWGNYLSVRFDTSGITPSSTQALGFNAGELFNMSVTYAPPVGATRTERFTNVSVVPTAGNRRLDRVLQNQSTLVSFIWPKAPLPAPDPKALAAVVAGFKPVAALPDAQVKGLPRGTGGSDGIFLDASAYVAGSETRWRRPISSTCSASPATGGRRTTPSRSPRSWRTASRSGRSGSWTGRRGRARGTPRS